MAAVDDPRSAVLGRELVDAPRGGLQALMPLPLSPSVVIPPPRRATCQRGPLRRKVRDGKYSVRLRDFSVAPSATLMLLALFWRRAQRDREGPRHPGQANELRCSNDSRQPNMN